MIEEGNERNTVYGCAFAFKGKGKCSKGLMFKANCYSL